MAENPYDARAYEERYRKVYEAGAEFWEKPVPTEALAKHLSDSNMPKDLSALDIGRGEGRDSIFLAKMRYRVTGIDASRSALKNAKKQAEKEEVSASFLVADALNLPFRDEVYDFAINVGCLHMIIRQSARDKHLHEARRVLKDRGTHFSCNGAVEKSTSVKRFYDESGRKPGDMLARKIAVHGEEVLLPIIAAWPKSKDQYLKELQGAGFDVVQIYKENTKPVGECWVLVAKKV